MKHISASHKYTLVSLGEVLAQARVSLLDKGAVRELLSPTAPYPEGFFSGLRGAAQNPEVELFAIGREIHFDLVALRELGEEDLLRERILDELLDRPLQRPCTEFLIIAVLHQELGGGLSQLERELLVTQALLNILEEDRHDLRDVLLRERVEDDDVVEPVEELGIEGVLHLFLDLLRHPLEARLLVRRMESEPATLGDVACADV